MDENRWNEIVESIQKSIRLVAPISSPSAERLQDILDQLYKKTR